MRHRPSVKAGSIIFPLVLLVLLPFPHTAARRLSHDRGAPTKSDHPSRQRRPAPTNAPGPSSAAAADELVAKVMRRLLAVTPRPAGYAWPPVLIGPGRAELERVGVQPDVPTAWISLASRAALMDAGFRAKLGNVSKRGNRSGEDDHVPVIVLTSAMFYDFVEMDPERLALVLGHELAHFVLRHVRPNPARSPTKFINTVFTKEDELDADRKAVEIALRANFSARRGFELLKKFYDERENRSSFEGLRETHPSFSERLAHLDREQAVLWRSMGSFDNGALFLAAEQYSTAEDCFRRVVAEFPDAYEAWSNLGYALLMQYCDALNPDDLRSFGIGQLVLGGFYKRPASLRSRVKGIDRTLWNEAVRSLNEALRLKSDLAMAKAFLGVAYLVHPDGKKTAMARDMLREAASLAESDRLLDDHSRASIFINLAVAELAGGQLSAFKTWTAKASSSQPQPKDRQYLYDIASAVSYNRAMMLEEAESVQQQRAALAEMETYFGVANPASAWWDLGYERYVRLAESLGLTPLDEARLRRGVKVPLRKVTTVMLPGKVSVTLSEPVAEVMKKFPPGQVTPVVAGQTLMRLHYPELGVEMLGGEQVVAISLRKSNSPSLSVRPHGTGSAKTTLRVGMPESAFRRIVSERPTGFSLTAPEDKYYFFPSVGLAARFAEGRLIELVIVQQPRATINQ